MTKLDTLDILSAKATILNGTCTLELENGLPGGWDAKIIEAGAKFFYIDGSTYVDGPRQVTLPSGGRTTFRSNKPDGCVSTIFLTALVKVGSNQPERIDYNEPSEPGKCWVTVNVRLGPKAAIEQQVIQSDSWAAAIEIKRS